LTVGEQPLSRDWIPDWVVNVDNYTERMDIQMLTHIAYYLVAGLKPPRFSQFHLERWDVRRLQPGVHGVEEFDRFLREPIAGAEEGVKSRTATELIEAIDRVLSRLSPEREPRLLYSFTSAHSQSHASAAGEKPDRREGFSVSAFIVHGE
jgi:hypothetical protein